MTFPRYNQHKCAISILEDISPVKVPGQPDLPDPDLRRGKDHTISGPEVRSSDLEVPFNCKVVCDSMIDTNIFIYSMLFTTISAQHALAYIIFPYTK